MTTMSAREINQDVSAAKRAAARGPVVITDRGQPAYVLLTIEEYWRLGDDDIDVDFEPLGLELKVPEL